MNTKTNNNNGSKGVASLPEIKPEMVEKLLEVQAREQNIRGQELVIRQQEITHNAKHASEILAAQERDREKGRIHERKQTLGRMVFSVILVLLVLVFIIVALWMNKDALVLDLVKVMLGFAAGAVGGYSYKSIRTKQEEDE